MLYKIKLCRVTDVDLMNLAIVISIAEYEFECKFVNPNVFSSSSTVYCMCNFSHAQMEEVIIWCVIWTGVRVRCRGQGVSRRLSRREAAIREARHVITEAINP